MFDNNWNIIIAVLVIMLVISYFGNCYEGFAGTVDAKNAEALALVSSVYNKDNMTLTNLNVNNGLLIPRAGFISYGSDRPDLYYLKHKGGDVDGISIGGWNGGEIKTHAGGEKTIMSWNAAGDVKIPGSINVTGAIAGPAIDGLKNTIAALETKLNTLRTDLDARTKNIIVRTGLDFPPGYDRSQAGSAFIGGNGWWMWGERR